MQIGLSYLECNHSSTLCKIYVFDYFSTNFFFLCLVVLEFHVIDRKYEFFDELPQSSTYLKILLSIVFHWSDSIKEFLESL